jgi:hypothetical protein
MQHPFGLILDAPFHDVPPDLVRTCWIEIPFMATTGFCKFLKRF